MNNTFKKKASMVWIAFILLFSLTFPAAGVFANGNGGAAEEKEGYTMFKIEGSNLKDGTYSHGPLTVNVTLKVEENEPKSISWSSNIPVYSVYVKGGPGGNTNSYEKGATAGSDLIAPDNKGISHVAFYYKQEQNDEEQNEQQNGDTQTEGPAEDNKSSDDSSKDASSEANGDSKDSNEKDQAEPKDENQPVKNTKDSGGKSTEIHLHLKDCAAPVEKVEVQVSGEWVEMFNPGNSPLYKLKDGGEFVKDDITAFKLYFESGEEQVYGMDEVKAGVEAEGSINYWLEGCQITEEEQEENPGEGTEDPGEGNGDNQGKKSTEIHLHLKNCAAPVEKVFVELNGEWIEMSNPGNSPLYKLKDMGEFVKDDITAFKLQFESGAERIYSLDEIKIGVEAEGSINYWLEDCELPESENPEEPGDDTEEPGDGTEEPGDDMESPGEEEGSNEEIDLVKELYITINENMEKVVKVTLMIKDGKTLEFMKENNLWKLFISTGLNMTEIIGIEIELEDGTKRVVALNELTFELEDQVIKVDLDETVLGLDTEEEKDEDAGAAQPENNNNDSSGEGNGEQSWYGSVLPKTGENSKMMFYIVGFLLMAAGSVLRMKKPINQL